MTLKWIVSYISGIRMNLNALPVFGPESTPCSVNIFNLPSLFRIRFFKLVAHSIPIDVSYIAVLHIQLLLTLHRGRAIMYYLTLTSLAVELYDAIHLHCLSSESAYIFLPILCQHRLPTYILTRSIHLTPLGKMGPGAHYPVCERRICCE